MDEAFTALRSLLAARGGDLSIGRDEPGHFVLERAGAKGKPEFVAAVQLKKSYVAYHLFPVYARPELLDGLSSELRARMQGKSCFNFKRVEPALFDELDTLTAAALG